MGFLTRRHGRKAPGDNNQQHGVHNVLRLLVGTTTLISPTHNGHHRRRSIVTLKDASGAAAAHPNEPLIFLGETTLTRLQQIFHELCGRSATFYKSFPLPAALVSPPTLTRERLARFLEHVQGAAAVDLPLDKPRYCFEEFLELWYYQFGWDASRPPLEEEVLDLSLPISHYFISSSHNTYLVGNQLSSEASVGEYQKVLEKNCRCIEIDVWNPPAKSGQKVPSRSKSPRRQFHRQHLSTSSVATSIHDGFEAVTNLLAAKMSHSRASSFSRKSMSAPPPTSPPADVVVKTANTADAPSPPDGKPPALTPQAALRGRLLGAHSRPMVEQAIEDDDNDDDDDDDDATVASENARVRSETQDNTTTVSQGTTVTMGTTATATAAISITAPDPYTSAAASPAPPAPPDVVFDDDDNDDGTASADNEPVVMHAHNLLSSDWTLGTHVPFRDVCRAVRNSAFRTNPLPIIVSLEVHTNAVQQRKMVKIMKEEWGDYLLDQPVPGTDPRLRLPTLGELQYKILVKVKKPTSSLSSPSPLVSATVATTAVAAAAAAGSKMAPGNGTTATAQSMARTSSLAPTLAAPDNGSVSGSEDDVGLGIGGGGDAGAGAGAGAAGNTAPAKKPASSSHLVITEELGSLAVYTESRHFRNFADRDAKAPAHIFSLSETTIDMLHLKQHEDLFHHNKTYLMRAYPNATKHVMSSNPDPACCWRRGVQMVALNWQTLDKAMMLNHGMFEGSHGWVRKPPGYRSVVKPDDEANVNNNNNNKAPSVLDANTTCPVNAAEPARTLDLYITVLAGQHVPLPPALRKKTKGSRSTRQRNGYAGAADRILFPAGIVSGRAHAAFRPVVKCELNVERADERCPEAAAAARTAAAATSASGAAPTTATTTVTATATAIAAATAATTATATTTATAATTAKITAATTAAATVPSTTTPTPTTTTTMTATTATETATATTTIAAAPAAAVPSSRFSFASSFATTVAPAAPSLATSSLAATPSLNQTSFPAPSTGGSKLPKAQLKQKTKPGQSDHPDWGARGTTLRFVNVTGIVESLSFVGFYVEDEAAKTPQERAKHALGRNDTLAGWACIRLDRLQTGYRFVRLMDAWGQATEGKLLVRIEKLLR